MRTARTGRGTGIFMPVSVLGGWWAVNESLVGAGRSRCQEAAGFSPLSFADDAVSIAIAGAGNLPRGETPAQS